MRQRPLGVLLLGSDPGASSPQGSLRRALSRCGVVTGFTEPTDGKCRSRWYRLTLLLNADAIVVLSYGALPMLTLRKLALAAAIGVPIVRWWVGSDVLNCLRMDRVKRSALLLDTLVAANVAVAPHLVGELRTIGISATCVPSFVDDSRENGGPWNPEVARRVLVYLPNTHADFYGADLVGEVIRANADLSFVIVADREHRFAGLSNVESLGWVDEMENVYRRVGILLRVTKHDGSPRMVLDAMLRRRHVIFSGCFPGCWLARTFSEVHERLAMLRTLRGPNDEGRAAAIELLTPPPAERFVGVLREVARSVSVSHRVRAILTALRRAGPRENP